MIGNESGTDDAFSKLSVFYSEVLFLGAIFLIADIIVTRSLFTMSWILPLGTGPGLA